MMKGILEKQIDCLHLRQYEMITDKCWSQKNEEIKYMLINLYVGAKTEVCELILTQVLVSEYFKKNRLI